MSRQLPELHRTLAMDGWPLALHRYAPVGGDAIKGGTGGAGAPVLLVHGLGTGARQFDLGEPGVDHEMPSLAQWLASRGYEVWAVDLRGSGHSREPGRSGRGRWDWCMDDHLYKDTPAILDYVLGCSGYENLHWVGHSMGGILLLCYCALEGSSRIASGVAAAAGFDYSGIDSRYDFITPLKHVGRWIRRIPSAGAGRLFAPLFGRVSTPMEATFYHPPNMAPMAARTFIKSAQYDLSGQSLYQLASLFAPGGLRSLDGKVRYAEGAASVRTPLLLVAGERDLQCTPPVVDRTRALLGGDIHEVKRFGRSHGQAEHYGHFDLFAGKRAEREVFPSVLDWMTRHPATRRPMGVR